MATVHAHSNLETAAPRRRALCCRRPLRLSTLARRAGLDPRREVVIAQRNGRWILQRDWPRTLCGRADVVQFVIMPAGGRLGRTVAGIGLTIAAAVFAPYLIAPLGLTGIAATAATAAVTAGLTIAGSYAINALIPLPRQDAPGLSTAAAKSDVEAPTYAFSLAAQNNQARLGGAIPEWFGYHRVVPDLAATAWFEWSDGVQTLYQTLCCGKGEIQIERIELGRVVIGVFEEVNYQVFGPGETANLFEAEVYQSPDVSSIALHAPNDLPGAYDDGVYGPFAVVPPTQTTARIGIDIAFPRGLYEQSGSSLAAKTVQWRIEARAIDDAGAPLGAWFKVADETFNSNPGSANGSTPEPGITGQFMGGGYASTNKLNSPLTVSYRYTLASAARYEVRCRRLDNKDLAFTSGHDVAWAGLRGFLGDGDYGDVTILQIAIRATASVTARATRQVAVTGTRKLPIWNGTAWSAPTATRSIAWAAAHVIRGDNGGRQPDVNLDLDWLLAYDAVFEDRGDTFNYYASAQRPLWEMLQTIMRCGRSVPYRQASMIRFHRDEPQTIPVTGFSRENIVRNSLRIDYRLPEPGDDSDGIEIRFLDSRTWNFNTLRKAYVGADPPQRPKIRPLDGAVDAAHVQRELDYYVAEYNLRPISLSFDTEMEGLYPSRGDLVMVQHDAPRYGLSNRALSWDPATRIIGLMAPPVWTFGAGWYARIRDIRGRYSAPVLIAAAPTSTTIVLAEAPAYDGGGAFDFTLSNSEFLHVMLGQATDAPRPALFLEMIPRGQGRVFGVRAVLEDPDVHVN